MEKSVRHPGRSVGHRLGVRIAGALTLLLFSGPVAAGLCAGPSSGWIPARWDGGPLEVVRRAKDKSIAENAALREAIAQWYNPSTLTLLDGTPINCLLVTFSAGVGSDIERQQRQLVKEYARVARKRGISVLGIVYPGADPQAVASASDEALLDGLVLDAAFPVGAGFAGELETALRSRNSSGTGGHYRTRACGGAKSKGPVGGAGGGETKRARSGGHGHTRGCVGRTLDRVQYLAGAIVTPGARLAAGMGESRTQPRLAGGLCPMRGGLGGGRRPLDRCTR